MPTFNDLIKEIKETLKTNLNKDNTEVITKLDKNIDELVESHKATEDKLSETQDLFINHMKEVGFKTPQDDDKQNNNDVDPWDKALKEALELDDKNK